jgi:hypothetical protein
MMTDFSKHAQHSRLLAALREHGAISTSDCRDFLAVMSPAARVLELRRMGHNIDTVWRRVCDGAGVLHRQGVYVLRGNAS